MATETGKSRCITCGKEKSAVRCEGCLQTFCFSHLNDHRQELSVQLDDIEVNRDLLRQILTEQTTNPNKHLLIKQIDQWEDDSIRKIQQTAKECRQLILQHTSEHIHQTEVSLSKLTDQIRETRQENDCNEIDLRQLRQKLTELAENLDKPSNILIQHDSAPLINKISVVLSSPQILSSTHINIKTEWTQNGYTIAGGNGRGYQLNQLSHPYGIYVDDGDQIIYIADHGNHRIIEWKCGEEDGQIVAGGNGKGNRTDQLNNPRDVLVDKKNNSLIISDQGNRRVLRWSRRNSKNGQTIISDIDCVGLTMDNNGELYVSDREKNEVRRWKIGNTNGIIVAGGNGEGNHLNQLSSPGYIFVDENHSVYVSDWNNHRVMKWMKDAKEGIVVAGGRGHGSSLTQLYYPMGLVVDHLGNVYVADSSNQRIIRWSKDANIGSIVVGGNGQGQQLNQFNYLGGLSFDREGSLYIVDYYNHRVQKFDLD